MYFTFSDEYDDAIKFLENRRGIRAAIYNSNLKRYIFSQYDHTLAENVFNGNSNDGEIASCSRAITDEP